MDAYFSRNFPSISEDEQSVLRSARVCVLGCGGLGGYCAELLARVGVGGLTLVDGDVFSESNMNRQLCCTAETLGLSKAFCTCERLAGIFPETRVSARPVRLTAENASDVLRGHDLLIDALDNAPSRLLLSSSAAGLGIPLVHGAVDGWRCQIALVTPGSGLLERLYRNFEDPATVSALSFTVSCCASLQVCEAVKLLLGRSSAARDRLLIYDLLSGDAYGAAV